MSLTTTISPTRRAPKYRDPFLDRVRDWIWPLQVGNLRLLRTLKFMPSLIVGLLVLWAFVGWRPWRYANEAIREYAATHPETDSRWAQFEFNPFWTTLAAVTAAIVIPWMLSKILPKDESYEKDSSKTESSRFLMGMRYMAMQLLSDPVGTLGMITIVLFSGIDPLFWRYKKPWYWRPDEWDWILIRNRTVLTIASLIIMWFTSRAMLKMVDKWYKNRKPPWLVSWRKLVMIALRIPDIYSTADRFPRESGDLLGRQEKLPEIGDRHIGVSPITSPFCSLRRWPTARLRTRPAFSKGGWDDYLALLPRFYNLLGNFAPDRLELQYDNSDPRSGYLVIHFAPPTAVDASGLIPDSLVGPPELDHDEQHLVIEDTVRQRIPETMTEDPFADPPMPSDEPDLAEDAESPEDTEPHGSGFSDAFDRWDREMKGKKDRPEGEPE